MNLFEFEKVAEELNCVSIFSFYDNRYYLYPKSKNYYIGVFYSNFGSVELNGHKGPIQNKDEFKLLLALKFKLDNIKKDFEHE